MALITLSEIAEYKDVSAHAGKKATSAIDDAERLDLKPLLGEKMYLDMVRRLAQDNYQLLLDGGEYSYDDFTYDFIGLKRVLIEFAYARLVFFGSETASTHGLVQKLSPDSQPISRDDKKEKYTASRKTAFELWKEVYLFLHRNEENYEYWNACKTDPTAVNGVKLTHIR